MAHVFRRRLGAYFISIQGYVQLACFLVVGSVLLTGFYPLLVLTGRVERDQQASLLTGFAERVELTLDMLSLDVRSDDPMVEMQVWRFFDHPLLGQSGYPMVVLPSGKIMYHFFRTGYQLPPEVVERMSSYPNRRGVLSLVLPGGGEELRDLGFCYSEGLGCYVAVESDPEEVSQGVQTVNMYGWLIAFVWLLLSIVVGAWIGGRMRRRIELFERYLRDISQGVLPPPVRPRGIREIRRLYVLLNQIIKAFNSLTEYAKSIGKSDYRVEYTLLGPHDALGKTLQEMQRNMDEAELQMQSRKKEEEIRGWRNQGLAEFGRLLREKSDNAHDLADALLQQLVLYLDVSQGGFYVVDAERERSLRLVASFAYGRKKYLEREIAFGEGLVGTCAVERDTVHLDILPEGYCDIVSGVGQMPVREVLVVPLKTDDELVGVLELASSHPIPEHGVEFVQALSRSIASTIVTVQNNQKTAELLEQAQVQHEQMLAQEEEMRQNIEEIRAAQEEASRQKAEMENLLRVVRDGMLYAEFDEVGRATVHNDRLVECLQVVGVQGMEETNWLSQQLEPDGGGEGGLQQVWDRVLSGECVSGVCVWRGGGASVRMRVAFSAYYDNEGRFQKVAMVGGKLG